MSPAARSSLAVLLLTQDLIRNLVLNPYDPPNAVATRSHAGLEARPVHPAVRAFAGIAALSGVGFVPAAVYPVMVPGIFVWGGWLMIAFGRRRSDTRTFWWFSLGWNLFTFWHLIWLRGGRFGLLDIGMLWVWMHLFLAVVGSAVVLVSKYELLRIERTSEPVRAEQ